MNGLTEVSQIQLQKAWKLQMSGMNSDIQSFVDDQGFV